MGLSLFNVWLYTGLLCVTVAVLINAFPDGNGV